MNFDGLDPSFMSFCEHNQQRHVNKTWNTLFIIAIQKHHNKTENVH